MKRAKIAELKNNLSRYLEHVEAGGEVIVVRRDRAIAKLVPITKPVDGQSRAQRDEAWIADLERRGAIRRGNPEAVRKWLRTHRPVKVPGGSLVNDLIEERRSGW